MRPMKPPRRKQTSRQTQPFSHPQCDVNGRSRTIKYVVPFEMPLSFMYKHYVLLLFRWIAGPCLPTGAVRFWWNLLTVTGIRLTADWRAYITNRHEGRRLVCKNFIYTSLTPSDSRLSSDMILSKFLRIEFLCINHVGMWTSTPTSFSDSRCIGDTFPCVFSKFLPNNL
jgi:hypothetical protein